MKYFKLESISNPEYISKINEEDIDSIRELYKMNNIIRIKDYDYLFEHNIINNAYKFYYNKKFNNIKKQDNTYIGVAEGTNPYNVLIEFDENHIIKKSTCTCPYYIDTKENCKHIYALLLELINKNTRDKLKNMIKKELNNIVDIEYPNYINNIKNRYLNEDNTDKLMIYYNDLIDIKEEVKPIKRKNGTLIVKL